MKAVFLVNDKTGKRFRVVSRDKEKNTVTIRGENNSFVEAWSPERFKELGYRLVQEELPDQSEAA